jgi:hypothetical protein
MNRISYLFKSDFILQGGYAFKRFKLQSKHEIYKGFFEYLLQNRTTRSRNPRKRILRKLFKSNKTEIQRITDYMKCYQSLSANCCVSFNGSCIERLETDGEKFAEIKSLIVDKFKNIQDVSDYNLLR